MMSEKEVLTVSVVSWKAGEEPDGEGLLVVTGEKIEDSWLTEDLPIWVFAGDGKFLARVDRLFADEGSRVTPLLELRVRTMQEQEPGSRLWEWLRDHSSATLHLEALRAEDPDRISSEPLWKASVERAPGNSGKKPNEESEPADDNEDNVLSLADA